MLLFVSKLSFHRPALKFQSVFLSFFYLCQRKEGQQNLCKRHEPIVQLAYVRFIPSFLFRCQSKNRMQICLWSHDHFAQLPPIRLHLLLSVGPAKAAKVSGFLQMIPVHVLFVRFGLHLHFTSVTVHTNRPFNHLQIASHLPQKCIMTASKVPQNSVIMASNLP